MTDIVERLREGVDNDGYHNLIVEAEKTMEEAASEIEWLRGLINDMRGAISRAVDYEMNKKARDILCDALDWL